MEQAYNRRMAPKLVIVDDAAFVREILVQIAKRGGYDVVGEAADGEDAVRVVLETKPDLVVMDIVMPKKSGIQATKEILQVLPQLKILACSTEGQESMIMKALEAGCVDYLVKPFEIKTVLNVISKNLSHKLNTTEGVP
jgi:two-component system chemotaxis response regulator CheY